MMFMKISVLLGLLAAASAQVPGIDEADLRSAGKRTSGKKGGGHHLPMCPIEATTDLVEEDALTACVSTKNPSCGLPRFITTDESCNRNEVAVELSVVPPPGPFDTRSPVTSPVIGDASNQGSGFQECPAGEIIYGFTGERDTRGPQSNIVGADFFCAPVTFSEPVPTAAGVVRIPVVDTSDSTELARIGVNGITQDSFCPEGAYL
ncbi:MAG: hypothetical protein SGARI_005400, partial [Bacillariaceae sp.]